MSQSLNIDPPRPTTSAVASAGPLGDTNIAYLLPICLVATLGGLLFGYDTGVISGAIDPLTAKFHLSDVMTGWASGCVLIGCATGVLLVGPISDRFGRKKALFMSAILFLISAIGTALPNDIGVFILFRIVGGLGIGIASISTPMYIAEITPGHVRGRLVAVNQIAIMSGITLVYFINYFIANSHAGAPAEAQQWLNETGWRWMFASSILPAVLFLGLIFPIPESPRWLIEQKRDGEADVILSKVAGAPFAAVEAANIRAGLQFERGGWGELLSGRLRKPLLLGIALAILQQVTGINVFLYFGTTIFKQMAHGDQATAGMLQQIVIGGSTVLFTIIAIATVDKWGRKPLMIVGALGMFVSLIAMGGIAQSLTDPQHLGAAGGWILAFTILYIACFGLSVGPVTWVILSEFYPTAVRGRALGLATFCLWIADYVVTQTFPMMDDKESWLVQKFHHGFPFYVYAFFCIVLLVVMRYIPETKGKSLEQIERQWGVGSA